MQLPWDRWSTGDLAVCSSVDNLRSFAQFYDNIYLMDLGSIVKLTGCSRPCHYKEYKLVGEDEMPGYTSRIWIFAKEDVLIEKELTSYSELSLLGEFGGALGMFLGFSFLMVLDLIEVAMLKVGKAWGKKM